MKKLIQILLFCSQESFKTEFIAKMLIFYGGAPKDQQGQILSEENIIGKLQRGQLQDMALKFYIDEFELMILWKKDVEIGQQRKDEIATIFLLLLELKQEIVGSVLDEMMGYEMCRDSFYVFVDKMSDKVSDVEVQEYENQVLNWVNSNMNVLIDQMNVFTVLFERGQESKGAIFNKIRELGRKFFGGSSIEVLQGGVGSEIDDALVKICSNYSIENVDEFLEKVKNGDFLTGCSRVKDRKQRKKLLEELQGFTELNQFILGKDKSQKSEIVGIKREEECCVYEGQNLMGELQNLQKLSDEALRKICEKFEVPNQRIQICLKQIMCDDFESARLNIKNKNQRQQFIRQCKECGEYLEYLKNKQEREKLIEMRNKIIEDLLVILKEFVIDPQGCVENLLEDKGQEVLLQVKKGEQQYFLQRINLCESYQEYLKIKRKNRNLFGGIKDVDLEGNCQGGVKEVVVENCGQSSRENNEIMTQNELMGQTDIKFDEQNTERNESIFEQIVEKFIVSVNVKEDRFEVELVDGKKQGKGIGYFANGNRYEGQFKNDFCDGKGVYYMEGKGKYEGDFKNGDFEGIGTMTLLNGQKFEGEWSKGLMNGKGVCFFANGSKYEGEWKDHKREGRGSYVNAKGCKYIGEWSNNLKEGQGIMMLNDGSKYEGGFKNDYREGKGIQYYNNGSKYEGEWKNNKRNGYGIYFFNDGDKYQGEWKDNLKEGKGKFFRNDGSHIEGFWKNNSLNGDAVQIMKNGKKIKGKWKDSTKIDQCIIF